MEVRMPKEARLLVGFREQLADHSFAFENICLDLGERHLMQIEMAVGVIPELHARRAPLAENAEQPVIGLAVRSQLSFVHEPDRRRLMTLQGVQEVPREALDPFDRLLDA
jgi:hypothetical protein